MVKFTLVLPIHVWATGAEKMPVVHKHVSHGSTILKYTAIRVVTIVMQCCILGTVKHGPCFVHL